MTTYEGDDIGAPPRSGSTVGTIVFLLFGPIVWSGHLAFCYGMQSVACALAGPSAIERDPLVIDILIWVATLAGAVLLVGALLAPRALATLLRADAWAAPQRTFQRRTMRGLAALSLLAIMATAAGTLLIASCAPLR